MRLLPSQRPRARKVEVHGHNRKLPGTVERLAADAQSGAQLVTAFPVHSAFFAPEPLRLW